MPTPASVNHPNRWLEMLCISLAVFIASLDTAITNTALPAIGVELGAASTDVIWVVSSYQLVMVAAMLPLAALADRLGYRRIFYAGLALFTVTSLLCGMAQSLAQLVAARAVQGLGAAAVMATSTALVKQIYPPESLGKGLGLNALVVALGLAGGPIVASAILAVSSWHWMFYINVPIGAWALLLARRLPEGGGARSGRFDLCAAAMCFAAFAFLVHALGAMAHAANKWLIASELAIAGVCATGLVRRERQRPAPILPADLFRSCSFSLSAATAFCAFITQGLAMVALPFYFHTTLGVSQVQIGLLIAPWPIMGALMAPVAGVLSDRFSAAVMGSVGMALLAGGIAGVAALPADVTRGAVMLFMACCGVGFGLFLSPNQRALLASAPASRGGSASGVLGISRVLGQAIGASCVALAFSISTQGGAGAVLWVGVGFSVLSCGLSLSRLVAKG